MYNNDNWYPESNRGYDNGGKLPTKHSRPRHLGMILALCILGLLVVLFGSTTLYLLLGQQGNNRSSGANPTIQPTPTSNPTMPISPTSVASGVTATAISTDIPTASATQKIITENKQFTCADCQGWVFSIKVVLEKVFVETSNPTMTFQFHFTNTSTTDSSTVSFNQLYLQDNVDGSRYNGQGDDATGSFDLAPGNDVIARPSFSLAPTQGREYTLHLSLSDLHTATMKNEVFTFS